MSDGIDQIAEAVLAVPGVTGLAPDPDAPDRVVTDGVVTDSTAGGAIDVGEESTTVHVVVDVDASIPATADEIRRAAHHVTGGRVDVTVEEVR